MALKKTLIVIAGPTAAGKTAVAIKAALLFNTQIISADSRQCYKELSVGVARPSVDELSLVPHHFIASHSIHQKVNAGIFEQYALEKAEEIWLKKDVVVLVGGTGLYIDVFCNGIDEMPAVPDEIRQNITDQYKKLGLAWLQNVVKEADPQFFREGEINNPHRLMRALEIYKTTGKSITQFKTGVKAVRSFEIVKVTIKPDKETIHRNIERRVEQMLQQGLVDEVQSLYPYRQLIALNTVGYKEVFSFIDGTISLNRAAELIKTHTKQYAKRQVTWFMKDLSYNWHSNEVEVLDFLKYRLERYI